MGVGDARACLFVCVGGGGGVIVVQHFMKYFVWTLISPQIYGVFLKRERIKVLKVSLSLHFSTVLSASVSTPPETPCKVNKDKLQ